MVTPSAEQGYSIQKMFHLSTPHFIIAKDLLAKAELSPIRNHVPILLPNFALGRHCNKRPQRKHTQSSFVLKEPLRQVG